MLKDFGNLEPGDVVIQNSANSGVGQAVIQLAKAWGYKTVNIIRPKSNASELIEDLYKLGADLVITEDQVRTESTRERISKLGSPKLGFNGVGGKSATNLARLLGENAYMVTYGGMSKEPVTIPTSLFIFKNLHCTGFWLNKWFTNRPVEDRESIYHELFEIIRKGAFKEPFHEKWSFALDETELCTIASRSSNANTSGKRILVP